MRISDWSSDVCSSDLYSGEPDFGLHGITDGIEIQPYAVIMPSASRDDKLWPEADWQKVFARLHEHDLDLKLLSGSPAETEGARQLVAGNPRAQDRKSTRLNSSH